MPATQPYLNATRNARSWTTPTQWAAFALEWQVSAFDEVATYDWCEAGVENIQHAQSLADSGVTPADAALVRPYFPPGPGATPPDAPRALATLAVVKSMQAAYGAPVPDAAVLMGLASFESSVGQYGLQFSTGGGK